MFGTNNPINSQINMYILSRIVLGIVRTGVKHGTSPVPAVIGSTMTCCFQQEQSLW